MLLYVLICLCLALAGIAGLQFMYMFYLGRIDEERKKRVHELEIENKRLAKELEELDAAYAEPVEEVWADVIDER